MKTAIMLSTLAALLLPVAAQSASQDFRTECRKTNSGGCSANGAGVYQAPDASYIEPSSVTSGQVVNYWKKQPRCLEPVLQGPVYYTIPGTSATATFYTGFKAPMHVESGSGMGDIGKVAFVTCRYNFRLGRMPK